MKLRKIHDAHIAILSVLALLLAGSVLLVAGRKTLASPDQIRSTHELSNTQCDSSGSPYINVTQKILNDADSGEAGNYWAMDTINRHIQVWKQTDGSYCAIVDYDGKFDSQAGQRSPGNTGVLSGNEDGTFKGGYRARITTGDEGGTTSLGLLGKATKTDFPLRGSIGTVDYKCDLSGNCPGAFSWLDKYFNTEASGFSFTYEWWGWQYRSQNHTWVNASTGNSGDVL